MNTLAEKFRTMVAKDPRQKEASFDVMYPTGFLALDFLNGTVVHVNDENNSKYYSVGITDGTSVTFIGRSGSGKTTLAIQAGANIIRPFEKGVMFIDDIEGGSLGARRSVLTKFGADECNRIIYRNESITAENVFERIDQIYKMKLENRVEFEYDTGKVDPNGNKIYKLVPTVYLIDSLAMLTPESLTEEEKLSGQMSATAMAKVNTQVFKRIVPKLKAANILLFTINHINDKVEINPFAKTQAQVSYLKPGETLPGGKAAIYLANNMFRLDDSTKLKESEGMGIHGKIVDVTIVKSRSSSGGKSVPLVFDSITGFDEKLSLLYFLKTVGEISAKGAYMSFKDYPDVKFTQKGFLDKLDKDEEFRNIFEDAAKKRLVELISSNYNYISYDQDDYDPNRGILDSL